MSRVKLLKDYGPFQKGAMVNLVGGELERILRDGIGMIDDETYEQRKAESRLVAVVGGFKTSVEGLGIDLASEDAGKVRELVITLVSNWGTDNPEPEETDPTALEIAGAFPMVSSHIERVMADAEIPDEDKEKLQAAIDTFASEFMTNIEMQGADASEVPHLADPVGSVEEIPEDGKLSADNVSQETKPVSRMNHEELVAHATKLGIEVPADATNADIKKLIAYKTAQ